MSSDSEEASNEQFVWRYGEEMVEKPENGQDGDCIVHSTLLISNQPSKASGGIPMNQKTVLLMKVITTGINPIHPVSFTQ